MSATSRLKFFIAIIPAFLLTAGYSQTRTLHGTVYGNSEPLPGVKVMIKQTTTGTATDSEGKFSLEIPSGEKVTLVFSLMGPHLERQIRKNEDNLKINIKSDLGPHTAYILAGATLSRRSHHQTTHRGFVISAGYRYLYHRFGLGCELQSQQGPILDEHKTLVQLGAPVITYFRFGKNLSTQLGAGFYFTLNDPEAKTDFKLLGGILYDKRFWGFGLRYLQGTRKIFEHEMGLIQNLQLAVQYKVN